MNILVLIRKLDETPLEREIRRGYARGDIITFYNESNFNCTLIIDTIEYSEVIQACVVLDGDTYYLYIQHGENPKFIKINVDSIDEINCFSSN